MIFHYSHSGAILLVSSIISILVAVYTYRRRSMPGGAHLFLMMISVSVFSLFASLEDMAASRTIKILMSQAEYLGVVSVAPFWFLFTVGYSRKERFLRPWVLVLLWIIPAVVFAAAATNGLHGLVWPAIATAPGAAENRLVYEHGPLVWTDVVYSYMLIISGTVLLMYSTFRSGNLFRRQFWALFGAVLAPWLGNFLYLSGFSPPGLDLTPLAFTVTGVLIAWGLTRYQLLDIMPVAYDSLFHNSPDGIIVMDDRRRVLDINAAALKITGIGKGIIGGKIEEPSPFFNQSAAASEKDGDDPPEIGFEFNNGDRWYDVRLSPLPEHGGISPGGLLTLRDISRRKKLEIQIHKNAERLRDEINQVRNIQAVLMPSFAGIVSYDIARLFMPVEELSGDFIDGYYTGDGVLQIIICDVTNHGIAASYIGMEIRSLFRAFSPEAKSPSELLGRVNDHMVNDLSELFYLATAVVCRLTLATGGLVYASAGHPTSLLYTGAEGGTRQLGSTGPILGVKDQIKYTDGFLSLTSGDTLLLYTDGVIEAMRPEAKIFYGEEKLNKAFVYNQRYPSQDILFSIVSDVFEHIDYGQPDDDISMICIKKL